MRPLFFEGKRKALTFSYDDGVTQDFRLVEIFNKYGMKCTFNLNSGKFGVENAANGHWEKGSVTHNKIQANEVADLYAGHEIAVHTLTHPRLQYLDKETIRDEIMQDRINLEKLAGYPVTGMAYPFGTYSDEAIDVMKECGIKYSRTVEMTKTFAYPQDFMKWHPTVHFGDEEMDTLKDQFKEIDSDGSAYKSLPIFYVWGHSYELDGHNTWALMEEFCKELAFDDNTWYATNMELVEYKEALDAATYSADGKMVKNNSAISIWFEIDGVEVEVAPGEIVGE